MVGYLVFNLLSFKTGRIELYVSTLILASSLGTYVLARVGIQS